MANTIRVLHVEDDGQFAELAETFLQRELAEVSIQHAMNPAEGMEVLAESPIDCIVSDYDMPEANGIQFLESVREDHPELPFILFTGKGSEEVAGEAISKGVTDYLQKGGTERYTILANRVQNVVERYHSKRKAEHTRTQLQAIADNSADVIIMIDTEGKIRFANTAAEEYFGYTPTELRGMQLTAIMPKRHREDHIAGLRQYLTTGERSINWSNMEFPGLHKDGTEIPLSISYSEFEQDGNRRFIGILRDISDQQQLEQQAKERKRRFQQVAENIREVVWMSDPRKEETFYVNSAYEDLWGRSVESLYDNPTSFVEAIHPEDRERIESALDEQASGSYDEEYRIVRPDGSVRWVHDRAVPVEDDTGGLYRIVGIASDITARKERELELEVKNETIERYLDLLERALAKTDTYVWEWDLSSDEIIRYPSKETLNQLASTDIGDVFHGFVELVHPDERERIERLIEDGIESGDGYQFECRFKDKDGSWRWIRDHAEVEMEDGEPVRALGMVTDITEEKEQPDRYGGNRESDAGS